MKNLKSAVFFIACALSVATEAQAVSVYDGIYATKPDIGYVYFREQNGTMVAVLNQTVDNVYQWDAATGIMNGATVRLASIIGDVRLLVDVVFTSTGSFVATQQSCVPSPGHYCLFPDGVSFTGNKIW